MPNNEDKMNDLIVVEKIAQWQRLKALVLDSVSSPITKRVIGPLGALAGAATARLFYASQDLNSDILQPFLAQYDGGFS
jgi:hypothetical protein